jgi:hypothetical protein
VAAGITATIITEIAAAMNENCLVRRLRRLGVTAVAAVFLAAGFPVTAGSAQPSNMDAFAKCLAGKKATMYGSFLCPHCTDQKKLFGPSFQYVPYVECSIVGSRQMSSLCAAAQIRYTPTWIFKDGERRIGLQSLNSLSEKTGCKLP